MVDDCMIASGTVGAMLLFPPAWPVLAIGLAVVIVGGTGFGIGAGIYYGVKGCVKLAKKVKK